MKYRIDRGTRDEWEGMDRGEDGWTWVSGKGRGWLDRGEWERKGPEGSWWDRGEGERMV